MLERTGSGSKRGGLGNICATCWLKENDCLLEAGCVARSFTLTCYSLHYPSRVPQGT